MADPSDLKFCTTDLRLVDHYLRERVNTGQDGFIKDMNIYKDEPWLLPHVKNVNFKEKEWFYFVKRCGKKLKRTVQGGTWKSTRAKEEIFDHNKVLIGYKIELSYYKKPNPMGGGDAAIATGWCMTEYWLASIDNYHEDVALCYIREKKNVAEEFRFKQGDMVMEEDDYTLIMFDREGDNDELQNSLEEEEEEEDPQEDSRKRLVMRENSLGLIVFEEEEEVQHNYNIPQNSRFTWDQDQLFDLVDQQAGINQSTTTTP